MVILGNNDVGEQIAAAPDERCRVCGCKPTIPYMTWTCAGEDIAELVICGQCCESIAHGFSADLRRTKTARAIYRMGFREGMRRVSVSGGLLYTDGTKEKQ